MSQKKTKNEKRLDKAIQDLEKVYNQLPDTQNCLYYINLPEKEGGCGGVCCKYQNPQVLYVEFMRTWRHVLDQWTADQIVDLIEAAMRNYLSDRPTKGCIFWNSETKLCTIHTKRPLVCQTYGIEPDEEFRPKYERLKVLYQDRPDAVIMDQCQLVETVDGTEVTKKMCDDWWKQCVEIEESVGIDKKDITDEQGGTYRTFHDHILLHLCSDAIMGKLQVLRLHGTKQECEQAIAGLVAAFRKTLKEQLEESAAGEADETASQDDMG